MEKQAQEKRIVWRGLTTQVLLFVVLPITAVLILISFGSLELHRDAMRTLVGERDQRTVSSAATALEEQLNHRAAAIQWLAIQAHQPDSQVELLATSHFLLPDFDVGIAFYSESGELLGMAGDENLWQSLEAMIQYNLDLYLATASDQSFFSEPITHPIYENYLILVINQDNPGDPLAVGIFSITNVARTTLAGTIGYEEDIRIVLTDSLGHALFFAGNSPLESDPLHHPGVEDALAGESGTTYITVGSAEHVIAFTPVRPTGWALMIEESWDSVASPLLRYTELGPLVLVPIIIFALGSLWLSARQVIQPLQQLKSQAAEMEWGNYSAVEEDVGGIYEIQSLQGTLIHLAERINRSHQSLRDYIGAITDAQEDERRRLAREMHDETLQSLIALNQRVQLLKRGTTEAQMVVALAEIEDMIAGSIQEVRRFTRALRPLYLEDLGLVAALEMLAKESSQVSDVEITFTLSGKEQRLPDEIEIAIYRMAQESVSNVLRHANAKTAAIQLTFDPDEIQLHVQDDGIGFAVPAGPADLSIEGHFGLLGIYERAELIGAACEIVSNPGSGASITISIPQQ